MITKFDFSDLGTSELAIISEMTAKMAKDNTGFTRGPQIIIVDDESGEMSMTTITGKKIIRNGRK
jgi:hypothetical protein